jgi:L-arabinokinase
MGMYSIHEGTTHGLNDTAAFLDLLNGLSDSEHAERKFFIDDRELIVTRAPGRLDLMGGIADYSGSLVLQMPIAAAAHVALQRSENKSLEIISLSRHATGGVRTFEMPLSDFWQGGELISYSVAQSMFKAGGAYHWAGYIAGAFLVLLREHGQVFDEGARILIRSEVPEGKGVSSSAALEVAVMQAIVASYHLDLRPDQVALLCQRVENRVAGAPCGVMDQMASCCGEANRLLSLLCQPGDIKGTIDIPEELEVWGIDSGIRHSVGGADYGTVRTAAFMGYRMMAEMIGLQWHQTEQQGHVRVDDDRWRGYLANVTVAEFEESFASLIPEQLHGAEFLAKFGGTTDPVTTVDPNRTYPVLAATRHPIYENARVEEFAEIMASANSVEKADRLGQLMFQSHQSYSTCGLGTSGTDELVNLVREAGPAQGLYGAKITGGGSGGTVAILGRRQSAAAVNSIAERYARRTGKTPTIISGSSPSAGRFGHLRLIKKVE